MGNRSRSMQNRLHGNRRSAIVALLLFALGIHDATGQLDETMQTIDQGSLAAHFDALTQQWAAHCARVALSSNMADYLNAPSYRSLVALGNPAIPLIIERYKRDNLPWGFALDDITGLHMIPNRNSYNPPSTKRLWLEWWESQKSPYGRRDRN